MRERIVVTGLGVITPVGLNVGDFWKNTLAGVSGISEIKDFPFPKSLFPCQRGGIIDNFKPEEIFGDSPVLQYGRGTQLALAAVKECLEDASLSAQVVQRRIGVAFGVTMGEIVELSKINKLWFENFAADLPQQVCNNFFTYKISQMAAKEFKLFGPNIMIPNACSAGNFAISYGCELIKNNLAEAMIVGGSDPFSFVTFAGFSRMGVVSPDVPRPFSKDRKGMMLAEGAAALLIESYEHARKRNAKIYGEVVGYGFSNDAYHITQANSDGVADAYHEAVNSAGIKPEDISYISVHGTGTPLNDSIEAKALKKFFGENLKNIPLSSLKSLFGHAMGAASAIEAVLSCLCLRDDIVPPTINFTEIDPLCEGLDVVPNESRKHLVNYVLETASGFGGNNCAIVFKKINNLAKEN